MEIREKMIQAACGLHFKCTYPDCTCKHLPIAIDAAIQALSECELPPEAIEAGMNEIKKIAPYSTPPGRLIDRHFHAIIQSIQSGE